MKKSVLLISAILLLATPLVFAVGKATTPIANQNPTLMGGADVDGNIVSLKVSPGGNVLSVDDFGTIKSGRITITSNGATARQQGPNISVNSCTFRSLTGNAGITYAGGSTVTNNSGAAPGFPLGIGDGLGPVTMSNLNQIYFAADTANDKIAYFCN